VKIGPVTYCLRMRRAEARNSGVKSMR
jgi:hypothetical protein